MGKVVNIASRCARFINQNFYLMTIPKESTFRYPGFPSLFVPYLATNDYFFSGHVSLPSVMGYEFYKNGYPKTSIFCFISLLNGLKGSAKRTERRAASSNNPEPDEERT